MKWAMVIAIALVANAVFHPELPKNTGAYVTAMIGCIIVIRVVMHRQRFGYTYHAEPWIDQYGIVHTPRRDPSKW